MRHWILLSAVIVAGCGAREAQTGDSATAAASASTVGRQQLYKITGELNLFSVDVLPTEIKYTDNVTARETRFPAAPQEVSGGRLTYTSAIQTPTASTIRVTLEEKDCRDGQSPNSYRYLATVTVDGQATRYGCGTLLGSF